MRHKTIMIVVLAGMCVPISAQPSTFLNLDANREVKVRYGVPEWTSQSTNALGHWAAQEGSGLPQAGQDTIVSGTLIAGRLWAGGDTVDPNQLQSAEASLTVNFALAEELVVVDAYVYGYADNNAFAGVTITQVAPEMQEFTYAPDPMPFTLTLPPGEYRVTATAYGDFFGENAALSFWIPAPGTMACIGAACLMGCGRRQR